MTPTSRAFGVFFLFLIILSAFIDISERWIDLLFYGAVYGIFWLLCRRFPQRTETILLLILVPVPHLLGVLGMYAWSIGNLSWDVVVHITSSFLGIIFLDSFLTSNTQTQHWRTPARVAAAVLLVILIATGVEVVEDAGERLGQEFGYEYGEGLLLRGPGDYCTDAAPCSSATDTFKDVIDNLIGILLGLVASGYKHGFKEIVPGRARAPQGGRSSHPLKRR